jgi:hypothetical protein
MSLKGPHLQFQTVLQKEERQMEFTFDTLPVPVNTNVKGPIDFGIKPRDIS